MLLTVLPQHDIAEDWTKPGKPDPAGALDSCHLSRRVTRDLWAISVEHHACVMSLGHALPAQGSVPETTSHMTIPKL